LKKIVSIGNLVDSPTRQVGESFFDYEYLREFEAKIGTARNVVQGTYAEPIYAKTPENPPRCHVPLTSVGDLDKNQHGFALILVNWIQIWT
jgi:hypothetical protein